MRRTVRVLLPLLSLPLALGLLAALGAARPAAAEPADITPLPAVTNTDGYGGISWSFYYYPEYSNERPYIPLAYDAGSRWERFDFVWPTIEPSNNSWNYGPHETLVADLQDGGIENIIGILLWTPTWAATGGAGSPSLPRSDQRPSGWYAPVPGGLLGSTVAAPPGCSPSPPQGLYLAWDDPNNHWGNYVFTVVSHFRNEVKYWELWNEPEWNYFWTGTSTDYAQLLKVGYQATKAACPDCTVLFGGLHYWANQSYYRWVLSQIDQDPAAAANNHFFDVMSVHLYSRSSSIYDEVAKIRSGMTTYNVGDHPIWLTETGVPVWGDPEAPYPRGDYYATQDQAAAYVIQSYANARAIGIERYIFFRTHDADMGERFGLLRNSPTSYRPAYVAYQVAATYLLSPTFVTRIVSGPVTHVTLWGTPRGKVSVMWNIQPTASVYTLTAAMSAVMLVNRWGVTQTVTAANCTYAFNLPGATANLVSDASYYIIGGDPLIVVEPGAVGQPPTSTVHAPSVVTRSAIFTVTWEGQDDQGGLRYDVQVRDGESGQWVYLQQMAFFTSTQFLGQHGHVYYFRSRAIDQSGNCQLWPTSPQASAAVDLSRPLTFSIGACFADQNRNGVRDLPITETVEITLTEVTLRFLDHSGLDVVSPTVGSSWTFTATVFAGETYRLWATTDDYMRVLTFNWSWAEGSYTETVGMLGLWPISRAHLPLVVRNW